MYEHSRVFLIFPTQCRSVQSAIASRSEKTKLSSENKIKSQRVQLSGVRKRLSWRLRGVCIAIPNVSNRKIYLGYGASMARTGPTHFTN